RLIDVNNDGYLDVVIGNGQSQQTRLWSPQTRSWIVTSFPMPVLTGRFGIVRPDGQASFLCSDEKMCSILHFDGKQWVSDPEMSRGLEIGGKPIQTSSKTLNRTDFGVRLRDLDKDGRCEIIVSNDRQQAILGWSPEKKTWTKLPFTLPKGTTIVDAQGRD